MMRRAVLVVALLGALTLSGCGGEHAATMKVLLSDAGLRLQPASIKAGPIAMKIDNTGTTPMRLVLVKADRPVTDFALGGDGSLDAKQLVAVDRTSIMPAGRYLSRVPVVQEGDYYVLAAGGGRLVHAKLHVRPNPELTNFYNR